MHVELDHITKTFGALRANDDISLTFEGGRLYAILGENGAGKSTLMKILSGYQPADTGHIRIDEREQAFRTPADALTHGIGMLHQDPLDVPTLTVLENFVLGRPEKALLPDRRLARKALADYSTRLGFALQPDGYIDGLTIGERQQLEIVRLLSLGARVLIFDEPTTGISEAQKNALFHALKQLARDEGLTVILVSHKLKDVELLCDQVYVLRAGHVAGQAAMPCPTDQLIELMFGQKLERSERVPSQRGSVVLRAEQVGIADERLAVESINLDVQAGEVIGLAGLDGSGQRPFLRACAGLQAPNRGRILLDGRDITHLPFHRHVGLGISYASAGRLEEGLTAGLTLVEHFALVAPTGFWIKRDQVAQNASAAIAHYKIKGQPSSRVETLSGGNQQRLLLALLPKNLKVLLLENPTRGLDVESARWVWSQLLERRAHGTAIVFTSPELDEIAEYSDRIGVFFGGRMTLIDDPAQTTLTRLGELIGGKMSEDDQK
ncbi:MAG: ABC transporter ATP-binding protein [Aggregatilineales bacterium]